MSFDPQVTFSDAGGDAPFEIKLGPTQSIRVYSVFAHWNGSGAGSSFHPCLTIKSQDGHVLARTRPEQIFAAGDSGDVTYAPFLHSEPEVAPVAGIFPYSRSYFDPADFLQLWYVPTAGGAPVQVTSPTGEGDADSDPDVSPDGTQIVFLRRTAFGPFTLYVVGSDGSGATEIDSTPGCTAPMWSPAGDLIVYRASGGINVIAPDGSGKTDVTPVGLPGLPFRPTWNHDGTRIGFQVTVAGASPEELWAMDADGTNAAKLDDMLNTGLGGLGFAWQNAADVVAYTRGVADNTVYTIAGDGTGKTSISSGTPAAPILTRYGWSPDDLTVYAVKDNAAPWAWYKVPADGSGASILNAGVTPEAIVGYGQAYARGGRVYIVDTDSNMYSVAPDGSDLRKEDGDDFTTYEPQIQGNATGL